MRNDKKTLFLQSLSTFNISPITVEQETRVVVRLNILDIHCYISDHPKHLILSDPLEFD